MNWNVYFSNKAGKQALKLSKQVLSVLDLLVEHLRENGGFPGKGWANYGKLEGQKEDLRHCHLTKGRPTYVCCWKIVDKKTKINRGDICRDS